MKIELETSAEIEWWLFNQSKNNPTGNEAYRKLMDDKQWVSLESLTAFIEDTAHDIYEPVVSIADINKWVAEKKVRTTKGTE